MIKKISKFILYKLVELSLCRIKQEKGEAKRKKLLIIRIDAIGDFIIFSPMLKYYRMLYPEYHITLLVNRLAFDLAERFDEIDELIGFDKKRFNRDLIYRRSLLQEIKEKAFDVAVYPIYSREPTGDQIVKFSGAVEKIGFDGDTYNISEEQKTKNNRQYTKLIPAKSDMIVETEINKEFIEALGIKINNAIPSFTPSIKDEVEARRILADNGLKDGKLSILICPGAGSEKRIWPLEKYAQVVTWLKKEKDVEVIISGSSNEGSLAKKIVSIANISFIDITGKTTLTTLSAILKRSLLYIGSETGIVHLAAAVGTPTVCIMGGGHFGRFFPYGDLGKNKMVYKKMGCFGCNWHCKYKTVKCIEDISVDQVLEALMQLMEQK